GAGIQLMTLDSQRVAVGIADDGGIFSVAAPGAGEYLFAVERIGYTPSVSGPVRLRNGGFSVVTVALIPRPVALDSVAVQVEAQDAWLRSSGFYQRRQEGMGKYLDQEDILKRGASGGMANVLGGISGVRVLNDNGNTDVQIRSAMTNVFRGTPRICL